MLHAKSQVKQLFILTFGAAEEFSKKLKAHLRIPSHTQKKKRSLGREIR